MDIRNPFFDDIPDNIDIPSTSTGESAFKKLLAEKYKEDPSKSGEIRQLSDEELQNLPSHMIVLSSEEEELLQSIPQNERVELYWMRQSLKTDESFADFIRGVLEERKKADELRNRS